MDWSALLLASFLGIATCCIYYLVDRRRKAP
jgi:hypothetical protein